jgi:hypothetical protein
MTSEGKVGSPTFIARDRAFLLPPSAADFGAIVRQRFCARQVQTSLAKKEGAKEGLSGVKEKRRKTRLMLLGETKKWTGTKTSRRRKRKPIVISRLKGPVTTSTLEIRAKWDNARLNC